MQTSRTVLAGLACLALLLPVPVLSQSAPPTTQEAPAAAKETLRKRAWDKVSGNWKRFKGSVRQRWGKLTHNEIQQAQGRREVLNGFIQSRYGIDREAADRQIDDWLKLQKMK